MGFIKILMLLFLSFILLSCNSKKASGEQLTNKKPLTSTNEKSQEPQSVEKQGKLKEKFIHFVAIENPNKKVEPLIKTVTPEDIQNATFKLYVESIPNNSTQKWSKGNNPEKSETDVKSENVRAVCLGVENDHYVFLTLRYFLDFTYPNHNIQGLQELPTRSQKITSGNADFVSYSQILRLWLSDVRHTGGGQILTKKTLSFTVKNDFELYEVGKYDFISKYSKINGKSYKDPIKNVLTAEKVATAINEINTGQVAFLETFGNHDVCLIKVPKEFWSENEITHLGLKNPSNTIRLLTEKQKNLYGFQFVLLSKEAYQAVLQYKIPDDAKESGIYRLALFATEIMGIEQVIQIKIIDKLLLHTFKTIGKNSYELLSDIQFAGIALDFSKEFLDIRRENF